VPDLEHFARPDAAIGDAPVDRLDLELALARAGDERVEPPALR
jgi:hypothetical protein